ncbi:MAG: hypothetical protein ABW044_10825 [Cellvibrio sp.]
MSNVKTFFAGATSMAAALTAMFVLTGVKPTANHAQFDEITVGRINIIEPDGTKRMIISNKAQFPGSFHLGKEKSRPDRNSFAGMLFVNEEGTESGGFIQKGSIGVNGKIDSGLSLTFDRFRQDQALQLINTDSEHHQLTGVRINDVPYYKVTSMDDITTFNETAQKLPKAEQQAYWNKLNEENRLSKNRIYLGTTGSKGSALQLKDAKGKVRMMLLVSAEGKAEIQMLDENGNVKKTIAATE